MKIVVVALVDEEPKKNMVQKEPYIHFLVERIRDKYRALLHARTVLLITEELLKS